MAIAILFEAPGTTREQYEQVASVVLPGGKLPEGMQSHLAAPSENGWLVLEIWDSAEAAQRFFEGPLRPELERAGIQPQARQFPVHTLITR
jgi:hypothetical protein